MESFITNLPEGVRDLLLILGALSVVFMAISMGYLVIEAIKIKIQDIKDSIKYKRRFKKKPISKCYCANCRYYDREREYCRRLDRCMSDSSFCSLGENKDAEHIRLEMKNMEDQ